MSINFDKYANEGNLFVKELAEKLGHPDEIGRTGILLRAVLHTLRDRITLDESLDLIAQLPPFIKAVYVDNWKNHETLLSMKSVEEFTERVKQYQNMYGEDEFNWNNSTEELVSIVLESLSAYITEGEAKDIIAQMPEELKKYIGENILT